MPLIPAHPEQKKLLKEFSHGELECQRQYLVEKYKLRKYHPQLSFNFRTNAAASYGGETWDGEPFVSLLALEMASQVGRTNKYIYKEYDFLKNIEGVGDGVANWKQYVAWTLAHELAHTLVEVERFRKKMKRFFPDDVTSDTSEHGVMWQHIYRDLRNNYCTEDRYPVDPLDFEKKVFHLSRRTPSGTRWTFWRGEKAVAWYFRTPEGVFKSNRKFTRMQATKYQKPSEIQDRLVSA